MMVKTYCDNCKSLIEKGHLWKITIEPNNGCISDLTLFGKRSYDVCKNCAVEIEIAIKKRSEAE